MGDLIPGLPESLGLQCLLRVPRQHHAAMAGVSRAWRRHVRSAEFFTQRQNLGYVNTWLMLASCENRRLHVTAYDLATRELLFKTAFPETMEFHHPPPPVSHLHHRFRLVSLRENLAFLAPSSSTLFHFSILNTVTWRAHVASPPRFPRRLFACGVIDDVLYVAAGVNTAGLPERSVETYDFRHDTWTARSVSVPPRFPIGAVESDVVFEDKLYMRCNHNLLCYDPRHDTWTNLLAFTPGSLGQLVATDSGLYDIDSRKNLRRLDFDSREWSDIRSSPRPLCCRRVSFGRFDSQWVFGHGGELFFVDESSDDTCRLMETDDLPVCRRLHLAASRAGNYHAGTLLHS